MKAILTGSWLLNFIQIPLDEIADEQRQYLQSADRKTVRKQAIVVFVVAALMLTMRDEAYRVRVGDLQEFWETWHGSLPTSFNSTVNALSSSDNLKLLRPVLWALCHCLTFFLIPILVIKFVLRGRARDYGLRLRGFFSGCWIYIAMYCLILPVILVVSSSESFQRTYPFYKPDLANADFPAGYMGRFWLWQCFYALQFISLELFFRGFMLHGMKRQLGVYSIFMMTMPLHDSLWQAVARNNGCHCRGNCAWFYEPQDTINLDGGGTAYRGGHDNGCCRVIPAVVNRPFTTSAYREVGHGHVFENRFNQHSDASAAIAHPRNRLQ